MDIWGKIRLYTDILLNRKTDIIDILIKTETTSTAEDEWNRSVSCLKNIEHQLKYLLAGTVDNISSFLPLNQPLYSLFLFVIVPSFTATHVYFRPPVLLNGIFMELVNVFKPALAGSIIASFDTRRTFLKEKVKFSDVVIFTGEYRNALLIKRYLKKDALLLFNGGALNPIIVTESANLEIAVHDVVRERLFNSGQDCMAPCGILISHLISDSFVKLLKEKLSHETVGLNAFPSTTVGQMIELESITIAQALITQYHSNLIFGGDCDPIYRNIKPTVFLFDSIKSMPQELVFSPLFFIGIYRSPNDVESYLGTPLAHDLDGYVSVYSNSNDDFTLFQRMHKQVLKNESLFDFESAHLEFGGYGNHCSFVFQNGKFVAQPILISKEIATAFYSCKESNHGSI
jgi:aldehyde dehydrogenase (NAD+)